MKKLKLAWDRYWFRKFVHPYLMKHGPECCGHLRDTIIFQMYYAGIKFEHINKWLAIMHEPPVKGYIYEGAPKNTLKVFFEIPPADVRATLPQITHVK